MVYYAQLNQNGICIAISALSDEIIANNMVKINTYDNDKLWRKYENNQWSAEKYLNGKSDLESLKEYKINELNKLCNQTILDGFKSSVLGVEYLYGFDYEDQTNFTQKTIELLMDALIKEVYWRPKSSQFPLLHTREQFLLLSKDIKIHKEGNIAKFWSLKQKVISCTTKEEINLIKW